MANPRKGKSIQIYLDEPIKAGFVRMVREYDPELSIAGAIKKLIYSAMHNYELPGYIKKGPGKMIVIENQEIKNQRKKGVDINPRV